MKIVKPLPEKNERQQTDESLTDERGKADESFETYRDKTESETDKVVQANRLEADKARLQRRSEADIRRNSERTLRDSKDRKEDDLRLRTERNLEDTAIEKERDKSDMAMELERDENDRQLNVLVGSERKTTDKNLQGERTKSDGDAKAAARLMAAEQAAHLDTRSALTTREEFVAIVSHDLRNPIGAILSSVEILAEDVSVRDLSDDAKRMLDIIKRNALSSLRLIEDILDMERIVEGKLQMHMAPVKLDELIREVVESFEYAATTKKISLKAAAKSFSGVVSCDKDRVTQILSNLIGNALKFTPAGGSVEIKAEDGDGDVKVTVSDSGPGIPKDQQTRIFERFAQIGNKSRSGLGLGLYISKTLVESHQGKLWVNSSNERGSQFSFTLPN